MKLQKGFMIPVIMILAIPVLLYFSIKGSREYEALVKVDYQIKVTFCNGVTDTVTINAPEGTKFGVGKHVGLSSKDNTNLYKNHCGPFSLVLYNVTYAKVIEIK